MLGFPENIRRFAENFERGQAAGMDHFGRLEDFAVLDAVRAASGELVGKGFKRSAGQSGQTG
ncbi:MAG: hypothetical protein HYU36_02000 [Planctomycetes bacterium]|nr:hypothetical protein [Planctomycetota bacterium]